MDNSDRVVEVRHTFWRVVNRNRLVPNPHCERLLKKRRFTEIIAAVLATLLAAGNDGSVHYPTH